MSCAACWASPRQSWRTLARPRSSGEARGHRIVVRVGATGRSPLRRSRQCRELVLSVHCLNMEVLKNPFVGSVGEYGRPRQGCGRPGLYGRPTAGCTLRPRSHASPLDSLHPDSSVNLQPRYRVGWTVKWCRRPAIARSPAWKSYRPCCHAPEPAMPALPAVPAFRVDPATRFRHGCRAAASLQHVPVFCRLGADDIGMNRHFAFQSA